MLLTHFAIKRHDDNQNNLLNNKNMNCFFF